MLTICRKHHHLVPCFTECMFIETVHVYWNYPCLPELLETRLQRVFFFQEAQQICIPLTTCQWQCRSAYSQPVAQEHGSIEWPPPESWGWWGQAQQHGQTQSHRSWGDSYCLRVGSQASGPCEWCQQSGDTLVLCVIEQREDTKHKTLALEKFKRKLNHRCWK